MSRLTLPTGVASFPSLFEATGFQGSEPKYSITVIWDEDEDMSKLKAACDAAIAKKWPEGRPANLTMPLKDGDTKLDKDGNVRPEFAGKKFAVMKSKQTDAPKVVDLELNPIIDKSKVYGGCEVRVAVGVFAYDVGGNRGVSMYLGNVQIVGEGQAFGGGAASVESDFGF